MSEKFQLPDGIPDEVEQALSPELMLLMQDLFKVFGEREQLPRGTAGLVTGIGVSLLLAGGMSDDEVMASMPEIIANTKKGMALQIKHEERVRNSS